MRHYKFRVNGVTFHRQEALGMVRMSAEHAITWRLVREPENTHSPTRSAVRCEALVEDDPSGKAYHCGYVPENEYGQPLAQIISGLLLAGKVTGVKALKGNTRVKDDSTPYWILEVETLGTGEADTAQWLPLLAERIAAAGSRAELGQIQAQVDAQKRISDQDRHRLRVLAFQRAQQLGTP